jgi:hypothetical protein
LEPHIEGDHKIEVKNDTDHDVFVEMPQIPAPSFPLTPRESTNDKEIEL